MPLPYLPMPAAYARCLCPLPSFPKGPRRLPFLPCPLLGVAYESCPSDWSISSNMASSHHHHQPPLPPLPPLPPPTSRTSSVIHPRQRIRAPHQPPRTPLLQQKTKNKRCFLRLKRYIHPHIFCLNYTPTLYTLRTHDVKFIVL